jgi:hypothetical protein
MRQNSELKTLTSGGGTKIFFLVVIFFFGPLNFFWSPLFAEFSAVEANPRNFTWGGGGRGQLTILTLLGHTHHINNSLRHHILSKKNVILHTAIY